jgi:hypothetical protein
METNNQLNSPQKPQLEPKKNWFLRHEVLYSVICFLILVVIVGSAFWWQEIRKTELSGQQAVNSNQEIQNSISDWKTYTNSEYGFEFKYPNDWIVSETNGTYPSLEVSSPSAAIGNAIVGFRTTVIIQDVSSNNDYKKNIIEKTNYSISGLPALSQYPIDNPKNLVKNTAVVKDNYAFVIGQTYYGTEADLPASKIIFDQILSNFRFVIDLPEMVVVPNEREVWVMNEDGSNLHRIYEGNLNGGLDGEASLSPLKNIVAFGAKEDPRNVSSAKGIKIVNLENNQINFIPTENWHHIFSPDGKYLGYFQSFSGSLSILDLNTLKVVKTISDLKYEDTGRFFDGSPDNNHLAYLRGSSLYLTDLNNNNKKLTETTGVVQYSVIYGDDETLGQVNSFANIYSPRFTLDGKHIIYILEEQNEVDGAVNANLWQTDLDGKNQVKLTDLKDDKDNVYIVGYFESQKKVIYTKYPPLSQDPNVIWYSYDLNTKKNSLLDQEYEHFAKYISSDGKTLIYNSSGPGATTGGIYAKDLATGKSKLLAPVPGAVTYWQTGQKTELVRF